MRSVLPPFDPPSIPVTGTEARFPVRRVLCIGKNYADHVVEMGGDPSRQAPVFFFKPADSLVPGGGAVAYPPATEELHYEGELVVALGAGGRDIPEDAALDLVFGYGVGIDFTRRDLQARAKAKGLPWDMAKGFDGAAPISALRPVSEIGHPLHHRLTLDVNGARRQEATTDQMIWSVPAAIAAASRLITLKAGDVLFTGTPEGVGAVARGDRIDLAVDGVARLQVSLV